MDVGIIGAGALGLGTSFYLSKKGIKSTLFESSIFLGGLGAAFQIEGTFIEKYHHFVCAGDKTIQEIAREPEVSTEILWNDCEMGYYADKELYPFTSPIDLLRFKPLNPIDRIRFGMALLFLKKHKDWKELEKISARKWLIKWTGSHAFEKIWGHLFSSKFQGDEDNIPLSWLHARISRRSASRGKKGNKECFGYVKGSMSRIFNSIAEILKKNGSEILLDTPVTKIMSHDKGFDVISNGNTYTFKTIVSTLPIPLFSKITPELPDSFKRDIARIRYQSIKNVIFILKKPFSRFFWINISDRKVPFPGIIEMTNLIPRENFASKSMIFLPNYLVKSNSLFNLKDEDLHKRYISALIDIKGDNDFKEENILERYTFCDEYADPYYTLNYSSIMPKYETPLKGLFLFNTSQIYPTTRNVNSSLEMGEVAADHVERYLDSANKVHY
ncbi:FAD-dependent oxidoreductase [bacterium]|nr:FAD-dependent oxidoreductase [bacterium]